MQTLEAQIETLVRRAMKVVSQEGETKWVMVSWEDWQTILELLEDLVDLAILQEIKERGEDRETIPLDEALRMLREEGVDV